MGYCQKHETVYTGEACPRCENAPDDQPGSENRDERGGGEPSDTPNAKRGRIRESTRDDPPNLQELSDELDVDVEGGDVVFGDQTKEVTSEQKTVVDRSETRIDEETTRVHAETSVDDSVIKDARIGSQVEDELVEGDRTTPRRKEPRPADETAVGNDPEETKYCRYCGEQIHATRRICPACDTEL